MIRFAASQKLRASLLPCPLMMLLHKWYKSHTTNDLALSKHSDCVWNMHTTIFSDTNHQNDNRSRLEFRCDYYRNDRGFNAKIIRLARKSKDNNYRWYLSQINYCNGARVILLIIYLWHSMSCVCLSIVMENTLLSSYSWTKKVHFAQCEKDCSNLHVLIERPPM